MISLVAVTMLSLSTLCLGTYAADRLERRRWRDRPQNLNEHESQQAET